MSTSAIPTSANAIPASRFTASNRLPAIDRYFTISVYLLAATGVFSLIATAKLDIITTIAAPAAIVFKGYRLWRARPVELSPRAATILVLGYFLFFPLDLWILSRDLAIGTPNPALFAGLMAAIHLLIFATIVRLYSAQTTRDSIFLALLAFASMLAAAILTVDTTFLFALGFFLLLAVSSFVGLEIRRSSEGAVSSSIEIGSKSARNLNRALGLTSFCVATGALALGGVIFFLIPRFTAGYMSALHLQPTLMTGFTNDVELGEIGIIKQSTAVVMRIRVEGDPARAQEIHWRGSVLTNFDGRRWFTPHLDPEMVSPDGAGVYDLGMKPMPPGSFSMLRYSVYMEPLATEAIFLAAHPVWVRGHFGAGSGYGRYLVMTRTGAVANPLHTPAPLQYDAASQIPRALPAQLRSAATDYPPELRETYLQLPDSLDPRIAQLAHAITTHDPTPYDKTADIERFLRTQLRYTLDLRDMNQPHPLAYFLFVKRAGHCEYFASAMVIMLRTLGIPARYVTGFLPGEFNSVGGDYIIRGSDAHSWVEAYFPGYGWIPFDPTPGGDAKPRGLFSKIGMYWDWFQFNWNEWVINYDFAHQLTLTHNVRRSSREWSARITDYYHAKRSAAVSALRKWQERLSESPYALPSALAFLIALLLYFRGRALGGFVVMRWRLRAQRERALGADLAAFEYRQMLRLLDRRGWRKSPSQTPLEFAASIRTPEFAGPVAELTQLYQSARFGAAPANARRVSSLLASLKSLRRSR